MSHDKTARAVFGVSLETIVRRIVRTFERATASDVEQGAQWYPLAGQIAAEIAAETGRDVAVVAAIISHLSPRQMWARNVLAARAIAAGEDKFPGIMGRELKRALDVRDGGYDDVLDSFSPTANKTRRFAANILGDVESVTVDVWAARVAGLDENALSRKGAYDVVEHAYRLAARRVGVEPSTVQATTWIVARNGRAS